MQAKTYCDKCTKYRKGRGSQPHTHYVVLDTEDAQTATCDLCGHDLRRTAAAAMDENAQTLEFMANEMEGDFAARLRAMAQELVDASETLYAAANAAEAAKQ